MLSIRKIYKSLSVMFLCVFFSVFLISCTEEYDFSAKDPLDNTKKTVVISKGMNASTIGELLEKEGIIRNSRDFVGYVDINDLSSSLKTGSYSVSQGMSIEQIANKISKGQVEEDDYVKVVIPEGFELEQIVEKLVKFGLVRDEEFRKLLDTIDVSNYKFLKDARSLNRQEIYELRQSPLVSRKKIIGNRLEGFLFPATYEFKKNDSEKHILYAMLDAFANNFKEEYYTRAKEIGMSIEQVITLASIIEREGANSKEFKTISSVFHNRLKIGMPLQSCATVQYIIGERKPRLSYNEIHIKDSLYNTYYEKCVGLPRGPIASPGALAIEAALYPDDTPYFYFVADSKNKGKHIFSKTLEEHNKAVKESLGS